MSESSEEKPVVRYFSTVEIQSGSHGLIRFRNWTVKAGTGIDRLCNDDLTQRRFAVCLLAHLSEEPALTEAELEQWDDADVLELAIKWWDFAEHLRPSPLAVDSLESFQSAVNKRNAEFRGSRGSLNAAFEKMSRWSLGIHEHSAMGRLTQELARQKSIFDFGGQSSMHKMIIERLELDTPSSAIAALREMKFGVPGGLGFESLQERMREAQLLSASRVVDFSGFSVATSSLAAQAAEAGRLHTLAMGQLRTYETAFDSSPMSAALQDLQLSSYKHFAPSLSRLESVVNSFKTPWIDRLGSEGSVIGIARLTALTAAAQVPDPFGVESVAALRQALGDWREVKMPWRLLPDTNLREQFYIEHGLDQRLIRLPEPAFSEALENVGLVPPRRPPVDAEELDEEEILRRRMRQVYDLLFRLERGLRAYIDRVMTEKYGADWERHRCHGNGQIYKKWLQKRDLAVQNGLEPERLIQYADFTEYADLITKADNWKELFNEVFDRPESVRESFFRLLPVRLCTMHARSITKTELMLASAEITRLLIAIGDDEQ